MIPQLSSMFVQRMVLRVGLGGRLVTPAGSSLVVCQKRHSHGHEEHIPTELPPGQVRHADDYKPGSSTFDYDNPYPMLNKGRFDWMFTEGWRRPLAADQGATTVRRNWFGWGMNRHDEYEDWRFMHTWSFWAGTLFIVGVIYYIVFVRPDMYSYLEHCRVEGYFELERRALAGLPMISPDLLPRARVEASLPSEEELKGFPIII